MATTTYTETYIQKSRHKKKADIHRPDRKTDTYKQKYRQADAQDVRNRKKQVARTKKSHTDRQAK